MPPRDVAQRAVQFRNDPDPDPDSDPDADLVNPSPNPFSILETNSDPRADVDLDLVQLLSTASEFRTSNETILATNMDSALETNPYL